jgi:hypothetical protein
MIVSEIYDGSGIGNQLWHIVVPRIVAEKMGYDWGIQKKPTTPFKACAFMTSFDMGKPVIGGMVQKVDLLLSYLKELITIIWSVGKNILFIWEERK